MDILKEAQKHFEYMRDCRRYLHENPELSGQEFNTIRFIKEELGKDGIEYVEVENGGVLGFIRGSREGKTVLLRADCDALPIQEKDNLKGNRCVWSKKDGVMHACGHDSHTAALLGAARILHDHQAELNGTVILCFERGEEFTGNCKYIFAYMEKNGIVPDICYGMHTDVTLETGKVAVDDSNALAGCMPFDITIEGRGGHGSRPDEADSPIDCFTAIYTRMQSLRLTAIAPTETATFSIGKLQSGAQANVIPQTLNFAGTMRYYDDDVLKAFRKEFRHAIDSACEMYHCRAVYNRFEAGGFATVNDPEYSAFARKLFAEELGAENIITEEPVMNSETFGGYLKQWPGCYAFFGVHNPEKGTGATNHNEKFDIDEDAIVTAACCYAAFAEGVLRENFEGKHAEKHRYSELLKE